MTPERTFRRPVPAAVSRLAGGPDRRRAAPLRAEEAVDADGRVTPGAVAVDDAGRSASPRRGRPSLCRWRPSLISAFPPLQPNSSALVSSAACCWRTASRSPAGSWRRTATCCRCAPPGPGAWTCRVPPPSRCGSRPACRAFSRTISPTAFGHGRSPANRSWTAIRRPSRSRRPVRVWRSRRPIRRTPAASASTSVTRDAAGGRWSVELRFQGDGEPRTLRVTVAGPGDAYEIEASPAWTATAAASPGRRDGIG